MGTTCVIPRVRDQRSIRLLLLLPLRAKHIENKHFRESFGLQKANTDTASSVSALLGECQRALFCSLKNYEPSLLGLPFIVT